MISTIPPVPGSYLLCLRLTKTEWMQIGRLGAFTLSPGHYVYLGSAHGPGGLQARLGRHLRGDGQQHWHIDALRKVVEVEAFGFCVCHSYSKADAPLECHWSQVLTSMPGAGVPVPGFGSSDCRHACPAHLVVFPPRLALNNLIGSLRQALDGTCNDLSMSGTTTCGKI